MKLLGSRCVGCAASTILFNISYQTTEPIWTKLCRDVPWEVIFKKSEQNLIPSKTLVAMTNKWNFQSNSLKFFSSRKTCQILKWFHRNVPWVTLFKTGSWNFDLTNIPLVNGTTCTIWTWRNSVKNLLLWNCWSNFETVSQECSLSNPFQNLLQNFDPSINMALVNGGYLHYMEIKKFFKVLPLWTFPHPTPQPPH